MHRSSGLIRSFLQEVSTFGINEWTLSLTIQLNDRQFQAALRQAQRRKGQRAGDDTEDKKLGGLRVDFSGLDEGGMFPAKKRVYTTGRPGSLCLLNYSQLVIGAHFTLCQAWSSLPRWTSICRPTSTRCYLRRLLAWFTYRHCSFFLHRSLLNR